MTHSEALAKIIIETHSKDIPSSARKAAKKMILDTVACIIAGWNAPGVLPVVEQMREWGGAPHAGLFVYGGKLPLPLAAFANSVMAHALDYDDVHVPSGLHIMSIVYPVALAATEFESKTGMDLIDGVILGVEIACRLGLEYRKRRAGYHGPGLLPTSIIGGFGGTAAACRIFGMSVEETVNALGIYYAQTSGNRQALSDMTLTKRIQPAFSARSSLWAACLARRGITGPQNALEGKYGLFYVYQNAEPPTLEEIAGVRDFYEIERDSVKRYGSCGTCHPTTEAAIELGLRENFKSADIDKVYISGAVPKPGELCGDPFNIRKNPQVEAQFSVAYGVALGLLRKDAGITRYANDKVLEDSEVAELAKRIEYIPEKFPANAECPKDWPSYAVYPHVVTVLTKDARTVRASRTPYDVYPPDTSWEKVVLKFHECAQYSGICSEEKAQKLISQIEFLEDCSNVEFLSDKIQQLFI